MGELDDLQTRARANEAGHTGEKKKKKIEKKKLREWGK